MSNKAEESKYEMAAGAICPMPSCGSLVVAFRATQVRGLENIKPWEFTCPHCGVDFVVPESELVLQSVPKDLLFAGVQPA